jgi:hypothetical protein
MIENTIICVSWGDKYDREYVKKLKEQCEAHCSVPFNFYCITDKPKLGSKHDITMPLYWDKHFLSEKNFFWAYRKYYAFSIDKSRSHKVKFSTKNLSRDCLDRIQGERFLLLDLDVMIHQDLKYFFELPMDKPWIVKGWWNDMDNCRKNYAKLKSTPLNSSVVRWDRGQLSKVWDEIYENIDMIMFTYPSADNYFVHRWYDLWNEKESFFNVFPAGDIYSYYKGNIFPQDMTKEVFRNDHKICLFNTSGHTEGESDDKLHKIYT